MTRFKVRKPYSDWIDLLANHRKVIVNNGIHGIHLAKRIKNGLPENRLICESVSYNRFLLMNLTGNPPKKVDELKNYVIYDI